MAYIIEGKTLAAEIQSAAAAALAAVTARRGRPPHVAAVACYDDYASRVYIEKELAACARRGITSELHKISNGETPEDFRRLLKHLSSDDAVDAVLVARPLPQQLSSQDIWKHLSPAKDIDGITAENMGRLFLCKNFSEIKNAGAFFPCTAMAVARLLERHEINPAGRRVCVIGRSATVGRPLAHILTCLDATVTVCHSKTPAIASVIKEAEIVVCAIGKARWLKADMLAPECIVIDVGTNSDEHGKFCGDADFENIEKTARMITPVPGGVGPVTLACLIENIVRSAENNAN